MLQNISTYFQRLPLASGNSTRHIRDMESTVTAQEASDFVLVESQLERLGAFARAGVDNQESASIARELQVAILNLAAIRNRTKNPRHRPPGIDAPLLRDKIVGAVLWEQAANPQKRMKRIVYEVGDYYGVKRRYIFRCLKEVAPERRAQIVEAIIRSCFWPEAMAHLQILAAKFLPPRN
jgi:hypothetical protein